MLSEAFEQLDKEGCLILEDLESSFDDFKVKPFKNSICEMMKMFAQIAIIEASYLAPILGENIVLHHSYNKELMQEADILFMNAIKREIVHCMISLKGRADANSIKKQVHSLFRNHASFDDMLLEVTE